MYDHTFYPNMQIRRSDIRPHIKWAVNLVILHMVTSIFLRALCGYIWVNILTLSPRGGKLKGRMDKRGYNDVEMKGWMQKGGHYYVQIKRVDA